ncbi:GntR family transcriptional regulator [Pelagibius sp. CAU 1746]|uniref:GntR family transcriptional regulator n=1 Tax=Pelagibius sp. CAU 1746 TaxID=3140370 RepID=UPI00325BDD4F
MTTALERKAGKAPTTKTKSRGGSAQRVYEVLRKEILELELQPGALLEEATLGARFGMSRVPVREALIRLSSEGLVTTLPNKNTLVSPLNLEGFPEYIDALDVIQRITTRLAAVCRTEEDLDRIRRRQDEFEAAIAGRDVLAMIEANRNFHIAIANAGKNRYFTDYLTRLLDEGRRIQRIYFRSFDDWLPPEFNDEHVQILNAIEDRNADLAEKRAHEHAGQVSDRFLSCLGVRRTADFKVSSSSSD